KLHTSVCAAKRDLRWASFGCGGASGVLPAPRSQAFSASSAVGALGLSSGMLPPLVNIHLYVCAERQTASAHLCNVLPHGQDIADILAHKRLSPSQSKETGGASSLPYRGACAQMPERHCAREAPPDWGRREMAVLRH